jgi:hypothetical protein
VLADKRFLHPAFAQGIATWNQHSIKFTHPGIGIDRALYSAR